MDRLWDQADDSVAQVKVYDDMTAINRQVVSNHYSNLAAPRGRSYQRQLGGTVDSTPIAGNAKIHLNRELQQARDGRASRNPQMQSADIAAQYLNQQSNDYSNENSKSFKLIRPIHETYTNHDVKDYEASNDNHLAFRSKSLLGPQADHASPIQSSQQMGPSPNTFDEIRRNNGSGMITKGSGSGAYNDLTASTRLRSVRHSPLLHSGLAVLNQGSTLNPRPRGLDYKKATMLNSSFTTRLNSNLTADRSTSFAGLGAASPEQRAINAQMEQERRVLDMINRV